VAIHNPGTPIIQEEGVEVASRRKVNFVGSGITAADDAANGRVNVTITTPPTHATSHTDGTDDIQNATAAQKGLATAAQITKLDAIEAGATVYPDTGEQAFLDADHTKLDGISAGADVTTVIKAITVEDPTSSEDITMFFTPIAITITEMRAVVRGTSPSVTWTIRHHATDRSNAGNEVVTGGTTTTSESTGSDVTSFNDATIPADSYVWLETTAESGTTDELSVTIVAAQD